MLEFPWKCCGDTDIVVFFGRILDQTEDDLRVKLFIGDNAVCHQSGGSQQIQVDSALVHQIPLFDLSRQLFQGGHDRQQLLLQKASGVI